MTLDTAIREGIAEEEGTFDLIPEWLDRMNHEMMWEAGRGRGGTNYWMTVGE